MDLRSKPIAITGASSGIGLATARACARAGMPVAIAARRIDRLRDLAAELNAAGGRAHAVEVDVDKPDDCRRLIDATIGEFGSIHAVFANAGYGLKLPLHATSDDQMRAIFETNFYGTLNTIRPALPYLLKAGAGHILICSSCLSKLSVPFDGAYSATKAAQDHIGRAMRIELAGTGVYVSTVHPIGTATEFSKVSSELSGGNRAVVRTPRLLRQTPDVVADAIVRCLRRPRGEVWTSLPMRLAFGLGVAIPGFADWILRRASRAEREKLRRNLAARPPE